MRNTRFFTARFVWKTLVAVAVFNDICAFKVCRIFRAGVDELSILICKFAHVFIIAYAFDFCKIHYFLKSVSREIANHGNQNSRHYAYDRVLKNRGNRWCGFCGKPCDIVDDAHYDAHCERGLERRNLRKYDGRQNHQCESYRAKLDGNETKDNRQRKHEREKSDVFDCRKSFVLHF